MLRLPLSLFLLALLPLSACEQNGSPRLETEADSLAFRVTEGVGGLAAWESLPGLEWEWVVVRDSSELVRTRHVWDKRGDRVRTEWAGGEDSAFVAVFDPVTFSEDAPTGQVALNGAALSGEAATERLVEAHGRFVNDGYWLLAPLKVLDEGVIRDVDRRDGFVRLALSFEGVGLTPGDRYWVDVEPVSGAMTGWAYILEGDTSGVERRWQWIEPAVLDTPRGELSLARMKVSEDERTVILTEPRAIAEIDEAEFTDLSPRMGR